MSVRVLYLYVHAQGIVVLVTEVVVMLIISRKRELPFRVQVSLPQAHSASPHCPSL